MIEFRDNFAAELGVKLIVHSNTAGAGGGRESLPAGNRALLRAAQNPVSPRRAARRQLRCGFRRSAARRRKIPRQGAHLLLPRPLGQWDPKNQRPELWNIFNSRVEPGESIRVFPLSNWTELDVWQYIHVENIPIVPLYFAKERKMLVRGNSLIMPEQDFVQPQPGDKWECVQCRMRSLGCSPCTGAIRSDADTVPKIIAELVAVRNSERENRVIDHDREGSMEMKKREGYF